MIITGCRIPKDVGILKEHQIEFDKNKRRMKKWQERRKDFSDGLRKG